MLTFLLDATDDEDAVELHLEHSLFSISKWESHYEKPFFRNEAQTHEETLYYINCMLLSENPPEDFLNRITSDHLTQLEGYLGSKQTATTFREMLNESRSSEIITSEVVYYWLVAFQINWETQYWYFNRLMTLIKICGIKQTKPKRMSRSEQAERYRQLNEERKKLLGTSG